MSYFVLGFCISKIKKSIARRSDDAQSKRAGTWISVLDM